MYHLQIFYSSGFAITAARTVWHLSHIFLQCDALSASLSLGARMAIAAAIDSRFLRLDCHCTVTFGMYGVILS